VFEAVIGVAVAVQKDCLFVMEKVVEFVKEGKRFQIRGRQRFTICGPWIPWRLKPHNEPGRGTWKSSTDLPQTSTAFASRPKSSSSSGKSFFYCQPELLRAARANHFRNVVKDRGVSSIFPVPVGKGGINKFLYELDLVPGKFLLRTIFRRLRLLRTSPAVFPDESGRVLYQSTMSTSRHRPGVEEFH
jgi:hypothetical protein